jgi:hypothetical protein
MADDRARLRDRPVLVAVAAGLAVGELAIVNLLGPQTALAGTPQVSAPPPFDVFHDLRWLAVYVPSWFVFVVALTGFFVARTAITAVLVGQAWPTTVERPDGRELVRRAAWSTGVLTLLLVPWVVMLFATAVFSLSYLWIVAVPVVVMISLVVHQSAITTRWWQMRPRWSSVGPILVSFASLTVLGALIARGGPWLRVPLVIAAGIVNAWCWLRVTHAVAGQPAERRGRPFVVVALAGILALVIGGAALGFAVATALERARDPVPRALASATGPPVLVIKGFNSKWNGTTLQWVRGNFRIRRFSYLGLDERGRPRPYGRASTHRSVRALARSLQEQVDAFHADTGGPIGIVAESEGALVALTYLLGTPDAPVRAVVVLSPLAEPGRVSYPAPGRVGWGVAAGAALDVTAAVVDALSPIEVRADTPLFRSIVEDAPLFQGLMRCRVPGVRELAVLPFDTGLAAPLPASINIPAVVRPGFHGGLLGDDDTASLVERVLRDQPVGTASRWKTAERFVQALASPWQVPSLTKSLEPSWRTLPDPDDCPAVRRALRAYVHG